MGLFRTTAKEAQDVVESVRQINVLTDKAKNTVEDLDRGMDKLRRRPTGDPAAGGLVDASGRSLAPRSGGSPASPTGAGLPTKSDSSVSPTANTSGATGGNFSNTGGPTFPTPASANNAGSGGTNVESFNTGST